MIQNVIRDMGGIAAFGVISVCLFFAVFSGAMLFAFAQRKSFCEKMRALPLDDGSRECSADWQSAVSQVCNLRSGDSSTSAKNSTPSHMRMPSRLQVGDTADYKSALRTRGVTREAKGVSHE